MPGREVPLQEMKRLTRLGDEGESFCWPQVGPIWVISLPRFSRVAVVARLIATHSRRIAALRMASNDASELHPLSHVPTQLSVQSAMVPASFFGQYRIAER